MVSYLEAVNGSLKLVRCHDAACTTRVIVALEANAAYSGFYTSLQLDAAGFPLVSHYDVTNQHLKLSRVTPESVAGVVVPPDGTYTAGQDLEFTVTFSGAVSVAGTPSLPITIGATPRNATYVSGSGTGSLVFRYQVLAGDSDSDGITVGAAIDGSGGIIFPATLTLAGVPSTVGVLVGNTRVVTPSAPGGNGSITPSTPQTVTLGTTAQFTLAADAGYSASVGGTCPPGSFAGAVYTTGAITADCTVEAIFTLNNYFVTPSAGANGTITPSTPQTVAHGGTATFTAMPNAGYTTAWSGTCPGTPAGNTFTTGAIVTACTVNASFSQNTYVVTPSAGANGTISPSTPQTVAHGGTMTFSATPAAGYTTAWSGTCAGTPAGNSFTTQPITSPCTVVATFARNTYPVTASSGANGNISPAGTQVIAHGATATFTVTPDAGYAASVGGTCGGTLSGNTYVTTPVTAACTVQAAFISGAITTYTGPTATGTGPATVSVAGGGPTCGFAPQGSGAMQSAFFIPVAGHPKSPPAGSAPGAFFPHGLLDFVLVNCTPGSTVTLTVTYPAALDPAAQYWKYGPTPALGPPHWYVLPATIAGDTATFSITDGALGDDDLVANGTIVDQGGPGTPVVASAEAIPTLSEWAMIVLMLLTLGIGARQIRRASQPRR